MLTEDGGLGNRTLIGWEPFWSDSGGLPSGYANTGSGQSYHTTALDGAYLSFQFYGGYSPGRRYEFWAHTHVVSSQETLSTYTGQRTGLLTSRSTMSTSTETKRPWVTGSSTTPTSRPRRIMLRSLRTLPMVPVRPWCLIW